MISYRKQRVTARQKFVEASRDKRRSFLEIAEPWWLITKSRLNKRAIVRWKSSSGNFHSTCFDLYRDYAPLVHPTINFCIFHGNRTRSFLSNNTNVPSLETLKKLLRSQYSSDDYSFPLAYIKGYLFYSGPFQIRWKIFNTFLKLLDSVIHALLHKSLCSNRVHFSFWCFPARCVTRVILTNFNL